MKNKLFRLLPILLIFISLSTIAQQLDYPTKKINGVEYYVYTVQQSEGLYSISKRFKVTQADINNLNPQIQDGLKAGEQLIIPIVIENSDTKATTKITHKPITSTLITNPQNESEFIEYLVLKRQTLFAISRKFSISQEDIRKFNPEVENGLREGMVLKIPINNTQSKKQSETAKTLTSSSNNEIKPNQTYLIHTVQSKETLYSLSRTYEVSVEEIINLNPELNINLKVGSDIKIPKKNIVDKSFQNSTPIVANNELELNNKTLETAKPYVKPIKIAFLLPFMLENSKVDATNEKFLDFYAGSLIAIKEAKNAGISFEIFTYDSEKSEEKIDELLKNPELKTVDFIIGPAYTNQISFVSEFAKRNEINTLIPFSSKVYDVGTNPYLFQFNPSSEVEVSFVTELLENEYKYDNIIFANIPNVNFSDDGNEFSLLLQNALTKKKRNFITTIITSEQPLTLESKKRNIVFFNTDKYSLVSPFLGNLNLLANTNDLVVFQQFSWPGSSENSFKNFCIAPFKSNINLIESNKYENSFSENFNWHTPSKTPRYDLLGYDLTNYFINQLYRFGNKFTINKTELPNQSGVQSQLKFIRPSKYTGFINQQLYYLPENK